MAKTKDGFYKQIGTTEGNNSYLLLAGGDYVGFSNSSGSSTIVQRDSNGYIVNNYFYTSGGGAERNASGLGYIAGFNTSDYYIRSYTSAAVKTWLGLGSNAYSSESYLPLTGGLISGQFYFESSSNSNFTEGIRLNLSTSSWAGLVIGGARGTTSGTTEAWWVSRTPNKHFMIAYQSSSESGGLLLPISGDPSWKGSTLLSGSNYTSYTVTKTGTGASGTWGINVTGAANRLYQGGTTSGSAMVFNWNGQSGQPTWLWGGTDGTNMYVYNPSNFNVASAAYLRNAGTGMLNVPNTGQIRYDYNVVPTTGLFPSSNNANSILSINRHSGSFDSQLGFSSDGNIYYRSFNGTALNTTTGWKTILDSANYTTYTVSKTGSGASGTWGISITGNAASATKLTSINTTFTGTYPVTFNVDGTIYSHTGMTFNGTTRNLTATSFTGSLVGNATSATTAGSTTVLKWIGDKRAGFKPSDISANSFVQTFSSQGSLINQTIDSDWVDVLGISSYIDSSGGQVNALTFDKSSFRISHFMGSFAGATWSGYKTLAYTDGTGASGTWGISISGNASTATALTSNAGSNTNPIYFSSGKPTASTYSFGNASGNIPISNGTLNTNLNADLLDGVHYDDISYGKYLGAGSTSYYFFIPFYRYDAAFDGSVVVGTFTTGRGSSKTGVGSNASNVIEVFSKNQIWQTGGNDDRNYILLKSASGGGQESNIYFATAMYNGQLWYGLRISNFQDCGIYFKGYSSNTLTPIAYYKNYGGESILNSEIHNSITKVNPKSGISSPYYNYTKLALITDNVASATKLSSNRTFALTGDVTGTITSDLTNGISIATTIAANSVALGTDTTGNYAASVGVSGNGLTVTGSAGEGTAFTVNSNATNANTGSTLVFRDASGNFSAGTITANLNGNASTATRIAASVSGTSTIELVRGNMADSDQFRILVGGTATNSGYAEIATADDGTEPIYVRQYSGVFSSLIRSATLLNESGNTIFPGFVTANRFCAGYDSGTANSVSCSGWFRSSGSTGWINSTQNAGIHSDTSGVVRTYSTNKFRVFNTESNSIRTEGGLLAGGNITAPRFVCSTNNQVTTNGGKLALQTNGDSITVGGNDTMMYINSTVSLGTTPKTWLWYAGGSSTWADFHIGSLDTHGPIWATGKIATTSYVSSAEGYYKTGSSNNYVLLGSGGHKLISDFRLKSEKVLKMVFRGYFKWSGTNSTPSESNVVYSDFCTSYSISRVSIGRYRITFNGLKTTSNIADDTTLQIFGAGRNINSNDGNPCYVAISYTDFNYFDVIIADDNTTNDSPSFTLYINQML